MKILIIEDEPDLQASIAGYLKDQGFLCELASDFAEASEKVAMYVYDCLVVDLNLPGGNGMEIIRQVKAGHPDTGLIILSARDALDDRLEGLSIGADDYLTKPFHLSELNARIHSIIRRRRFQGANEVVFGEITLDPQSRRVFVCGEELILTPKEYGLLSFFLANRDRVVGKEALSEHIWGDHIDMADHFDFLYTHIKNLRRKLMQAGAEDYIRTVYGIGYKWQAK
ncbi:MAG: response regulator transcription factor [Flavobacteriales bacterium]|nr:response regulator transcription factor [Flavobacteriales bacterium]MCB9449698.1 response regulator transcription factor [Flavobacteriales bacterium]